MCSRGPRGHLPPQKAPAGAEDHPGHAPQETSSPSRVALPVPLVWPLHHLRPLMSGFQGRGLGRPASGPQSLPTSPCGRCPAGTVLPLEIVGPRRQQPPHPLTVLAQATPRLWVHPTVELGGLWPGRPLGAQAHGAAQPQQMGWGWGSTSSRSPARVPTGSVPHGREPLAWSPRVQPIVGLS